MCDACLRPQFNCICALVVPIKQTTDVLILQHPLEVHHAKNTARLLHLSLPGSRLVVGETFSEAQLQALLPASHYVVLLYPPTPSDQNTHAAPKPLDAARLTLASQVTLVVLDATWRKSRKMLHTSPKLQHLPRLALNDLPASGYTVRKAHKEGQLSTLEATCAALAQLEGDDEKFVPLQAAFHAFVARLEAQATTLQR
jgi:DTW domain-containing protein YfiP